MAKKKVQQSKPREPSIEDPENVALRQREYKSRRHKRGEMRVALWVPDKRVEQLRAIATMWRREAELKDGVKSPTPAVKVPKVEIPELPPPGYAWIRVEAEELAMQKLLKVNGGEWSKDAQAWRLRSDLVDKMGLRSRVVSKA